VSVAMTWFQPAGLHRESNKIFAEL